MIAFQDPLGQLPPPASTFAADHDALFYFLTWVSLGSFALILGLLVYSSIRWRRRSEDQLAASDVTHNTKLEVIWTLVPTVVVIVVFAWGFKGVLPQQVAPADARKYRAEAFTYGWNLYHPGETTKSETLYFEVDKPALVSLTSQDVLHAFYIPAFRAKRDIVPGFRNQIWFQPNRIGEYTLYCAEYCGTGHSLMRKTIHVVSAEDYAKKPWNVLPETAEGRGEYYYKLNGCAACHSTMKDVRLVGPSFHGLFGRQGRFDDGSSYTADEAYITQSIRDPHSQVVESYTKGLMPVFTEAQINAEQLADLITWIKTLK
ncbi:MAG: cytochrome c oxidase subunit II [Planctomycetota bacterium]